MNDKQLLAQIAVSDQDAFKSLHECYITGLIDRASYIVGDRYAAEDVVQDAFLQVWRKANTFNPSRGEVINWLHYIVRNRAIDMLRHQRIQQEENWIDIDGKMDDSIEPGMRVEQRIIQIEKQRFLLRMLDRLPYEQRMVIQLSYFQGFSQAEIARMLHEPLGTIKTRMRSGLKKLRKYEP